MDKTNQKPIGENPDTPENVSAKDERYITRSYFACHGRSYTFGCTQYVGRDTRQDYPIEVTAALASPKFWFSIFVHKIDNEKEMIYN